MIPYSFYLNNNLILFAANSQFIYPYLTIIIIAHFIHARLLIFILSHCTRLRPLLLNYSCLLVCCLCRTLHVHFFSLSQLSNSQH